MTSHTKNQIQLASGSAALLTEVNGLELWKLRCSGYVLQHADIRQINLQPHADKPSPPQLCKWDNKPALACTDVSPAFGLNLVVVQHPWRSAESAVEAKVSMPFHVEEPGPIVRKRSNLEEDLKAPGNSAAD